MGVIIKNLISDITSYIDYLKKQHGLYISIHVCSGELYYYMKDFSKCNLHDNPYCLFVKTNGEIWSKCVSRQYKITEKCSNGPFYGMCFCGVEEFIVPVEYNEKIVGFISVGSFRSNIEKGKNRIEYISNVYNMDKNQLLKLYEDNLSPVKPDAAFIASVTNVIAHMLELLCINHFKLNGLSKNNYHDENYIYGHILVYLQRNFSSKITLDDISKLCNCSKSYISHLFKKRSGCNLNEYINRIRIKEAKNLLTETTLSMMEISQKTGFYDSNYFANTFKKQCGVSPSQYRNEKKRGM